MVIIMNKKKLSIGILILLIGVIAIIAVLNNDTTIIINAGILIYRIFFIISMVLIVIGVLIIATTVSIFYIKRNKELKEKAIEEATKQEEIRKKKEDVKGLVNNLMANDESFLPIGNALLKDMSEIDEYVERNCKLFEFNDMSEFENMKEIMASVKSAVYHNCRSIVNLYVALESGEEFQTEAKSILSNNEELMHNSKEFLLQMARYTNEQNEDTDAVTMIQSYADAIGQSLKHSYN